jgi:hypothetical protein
MALLKEGLMLLCELIAVHHRLGRAVELITALAGAGL